MITIAKKENTFNEYILVELRGLSTDEKPTTFNDLKVGNGSTFVEINTGKIYLYDLENQEWNEI